jgi:hypothetical protein
MMDATIEPTRKSERDTTTSTSKQVNPADSGEEKGGLPALADD